MRQKTLLSWSSGKDSAWALHVLRRDPTIHTRRQVAVTATAELPSLAGQSTAAQLPCPI